MELESILGLINPKTKPSKLVTSLGTAEVVQVRGNLYVTQLTVHKM